MVLLKHDLPDGTSHFDWLIERDVIGQQRTDVRGRDGDERCLIAFRVLDRVDVEKVATFSADRMEDHRYAYLEHQGAVNGGRGSVARVASGIARHVVEAGGTISIRGKWAKGEERVWAGKADTDLWVFVRSAVLIGRPKPARKDEDQPRTLGDILGADADSPAKYPFGL